MWERVGQPCATCYAACAACHRCSPPVCSISRGAAAAPGALLMHAPPQQPIAVAQPNMMFMAYVAAAAAACRVGIWLTYLQLCDAEPGKWWHAVTRKGTGYGVHWWSNWRAAHR